MKRFLPLIFFLIVCVKLVGGDQPIFFLTKERTGATWLLYITQALTQKRMYGFDRSQELDLRYPLDIDHSLKPICRSHMVHKMSKDWNQKEGLLIVTLRDYHEVLFRGPPHERFIKFSKTLRTELEKYVAILRFYDNFPPSRRKLICYETLISDPVSEISSLFSFFQQHALVRDETSLNAFFEDYEDHREYMINRYDQNWTSYTRGKYIHFHKKKCSPKLAKKIRIYLQRECPNIWEKYFRRYI